MIRILVLALVCLCCAPALAQQAHSGHRQRSSQARAHKRGAAKQAHKAEGTHPPRAHAAREHTAPKAAAAAPKHEAGADEHKAGAPAEVKGDHAGATPAVHDQAPPQNTPGSSEIRTEGDTQVKVMEFSGLDIEGQLKTPQMLYFLNRMRAEFGRPRLPHRSFMPELERSTKESTF